MQVDDRSSAQISVTHGVPQGSILGPVLFNLYVNDLSSALPSEVVCHQYADDTMMYTHFRPSDLEVGQSVIQDALNKLSDWSLECNLALNSKNTKVMILSSAQLSMAHGLETSSLDLTVDGKRLERVSNFRLLGSHVNQHLNWKDEINLKISSCYAKLPLIRKLKHLTPFHVRKQLAECLILSKIDYNDIVSHPIPEYLLKRLQRVQLAAAGFVLGRYVHMPDLIKLGWMPIKERRENHLLNTVFKALHCNDWPSYLKLDIHDPTRTLRSSRETTLKVPLETGTFQDSASNVFSLPHAARNSVVFSDFKTQVKKYLINRANARLTS